MRFTELFADFGSSWPIEFISTAWPPDDSDIPALVAQIDDAIEIHEPVTDVSAAGTVTVTGKLKPRNLPARTELVGALFPSIRFVFAGDSSWSSDFRVSVAADDTVTLQIDTLPLEVLVPSDLLAEHLDEDKRGADTDITLATHADHSVIKRNFSLHLEAQGHLRLESHLPISIGPCRLFGIPMKAVHDLTFIGAPSRAHKLHDWIVRPLNGQDFPLDGGGFGFGGIEVDWEAEESPMASLREKLRIQEDAELVVEDVVIPAMFFPPFPKHGTIGIRRSVDPGESLEELLTFQDAPIQIPLGDSATLFFNQLYFKTPDAEQSLGDGLSLEAGVAVSFGGAEEGGDDEGRWEFELGLIDGDLLRLSIARPIPAADDPAIPLINLQIFELIVIDILRLRAGVSIGELQKENPDAGDAIQILGDLLIREVPDEDGESVVEVETEDGDPFEIAITDLGWDRGDFSVEQLKAEGVALTMGPFALEVYEMGLVAEHGATYISLSGGIRESTSPFTGKVWFTRLRGRLAGNPDAPSFKINGFGAELEIEDVVEIAVHGHFRNELLADNTRVKEHGLGGKIVIHAGGNEWGLSLDVYWGERIPPADPSTDYLLFQVVFFGAIPMGPMELRQIEALYADDLTPKLSSDDREAGELRYYSWLKKSRPTALAENRGLTQWKPENEAWAFGAGFGISFTGCGDICLLQAFGLGFDSEKEAGLVIVLELKLLGGDKPIALGIFEYDFKRDAFVLQIKIDISLDQLIDNFPEELKVQLGGTMTFANKPGLVAFGRIEDQESWLGAKIELELSSVASLKVRIALCFEWLEGEYTAVGFVFSIQIRGDLGIVVIEGWASLLAMLRWMICGTGDFVARLTVDLGLSILLFRFLRFGISSNLLVEWLAHTPDFFVLRATFRLETPWFLPDVSVSVEVVDGTLEPAARGVITCPLLNSVASARRGALSTRVQRLDGRGGGEAPRLFAINELPGTAFVWKGSVTPVPLDGTIEIQFSPMLIDRLGIGATNADLGVQSTGDEGVELKARYSLSRLELRRRSIGGTTWDTVETIGAAVDSRHFRWLWDADTRTGGETAPKKLILNGATPFTVSYANPSADAEILMENPEYPCCQKRPPDVARLDFCDDALGVVPDGFSRSMIWLGRGGRAPIRVRGGAFSVHAPAQPGAACDRVAAFEIGSGSVLTLASEEDLHRTEIHMAATGRKLFLTVVARDSRGETVFRLDDSIGGHQPFSTVLVAPGRDYRAVELYLRLPTQDQDPDGQLVHHSLELDWIECVTSDDQARAEVDEDRCNRIDSGGHGENTPFLPRHEYELLITTDIEVRHTATEWESRSVVEKIGFETAGPPGLNETPEPGLELQPYVVSARAGGRGLLYREESVHLVLSPEVKLFGPGPGGSDEFTYRLPVTLTVGTSFESEPSNRHGKSSHEGAEWFVDRRGELPWFVAVVLLDTVSAPSDDPLLLRYRTLSEESAGTCPPDDVWNEARPRLGVDPFDARGRPLWEPRTVYHAAMRPEGGPIVDRDPFEPGDIGTFLNITGTWELDEGGLQAVGAATGRFGETDWDYLHLELATDLQLGNRVSASVLIDPGNDGGGIRFTIIRRSENTGTLTAENVTGGGSLGNVSLDAFPDTINLQVDVFADAVRCRVAGAEISVPRDSRGSGICEIGGQDVKIRSLKVRGIEMYGFDFTTSRYESFADHVASAPGGNSVLIGDAAEALSTLSPRIRGEIDAVMRPEAADSDRERVFAEAAQALAMPLREDPVRVHLDVATHDADRWLLLESPEPMDFTEEIRLQLFRRVVRRPPIRPGLWEHIFDSIRDVFEPMTPFQPPIRDPHLLGPLGRRLTEPTHRIEIAPSDSDDEAFTVRIRDRRIEIRDERTGRTTRRRIPLMSPIERSRLFDTDLHFDRWGRLIDWLHPSIVEWQLVDVLPLQNGDATKALLLPESVGAFPNGSWRLDLHLERKWFDTTDPIGPGNAYIADATLPFIIV